VTDAQDRRALSDALTRALHLAVPPIAITFEDVPVEDAPAFDEPMSEPTADGRSGRVSAGCVFWVRSAERTFTTVPADHGNCSVGSYTHGMASFADIADRSDVSALVDSGWVAAEAVSHVPHVAGRPAGVTYGPLAEAARQPDVVLLRVNGRQLMVLSDAIPGLRIEGKPQCHIVAIAKEQGVPAASVGCALSRARTGMRPDEMTFAMPGHQLAHVVAAVERTAAVDSVVAKYAAEDARRFA
jgi:uncharacterized protein (DUF169 family)